MRYVGKWVFHSIGMINENDELVYLDAEQYLNTPMPYVDMSDEEAVEDDLKERRQMTRSQLAVCEDGKLYMLTPLPEGVSKEEVEEAVKAGEVKLYDGMMTDEPMACEERDGALWLEVGEGMSLDGWVQLSDEDGYLNFMNIRYVKAD